MEDEPPLSFDELVIYRQKLQKFCLAHYKSLIAFQDGISFKFHLKEKRLGLKARHLSSSATCIESLLDCPGAFLPLEPINIEHLATNFAHSAMMRPRKGWLSDKAAPIYCRCRTLPLVMGHITHYPVKIQQHLEYVLFQLTKDVSRLAIGEASPGRAEPYRPSAFHTYWFLHLLSTIEAAFPREFARIVAAFQPGRFNVDRLRAEMRIWAQRSAAYQSALHAADSVKLDSDQLAWSLTILGRFGIGLQANLAQQDFIKHALKCLFAQQNAAGIWRTGAPLFHYPSSGNAYCYVYETFAVLLKSALTDQPEGLFLRQAMLPYGRNLLKLWDYATSTQIPLSEDGKTLGWSSGHRVNHREPESWATASVFAFAQSLRRLIGIWAREAAAMQLKVATSHGLPKEALKNLADRGHTWPVNDNRTAAMQLMTLFVNACRFFGSGNLLEPDSRPINDVQARGAILFGPPGTSKTFLARSVADAIGWDYVELHASHFVADGLPNVQRRANAIFDELMQLDRTVILFDEIDELVRARDIEADAFGRFLTTSMLPKLAELWSARKVIYFVATNHIRFFDPAVTRAQRFDALVHVSPPAFRKKIERLSVLLRIANAKRITSVQFTRRDVEKALQQATKTINELSPLEATDVLAKFLLIRYDQLQEIASAIHRLRPKQKRLTLTRNLMEQALLELSDPALDSCATYKEFGRSIQYEAHDFSKVAVWRVKGNVPAKVRRRVKTGGFYSSNAEFGDFSALPCKCTIRPPDGIKLS